MECIPGGMQLRVKCAYDNQQGLKRIREYMERYVLDLRTMIWTRGEKCPLSALSMRLRSRLAAQ